MTQTMTHIYNHDSDTKRHTQWLNFQVGVFEAIDF